MYNFPILIGDIGGTNARFAIILDAHSGKIEFEPARLADFTSIEDLIQTCVLDKTAAWPRTMILAVAAPLHKGDNFQLTNAKLDIKPIALLDYFNLDELVLMNDFAGQALAAVALEEPYLKLVGSGENQKPPEREAISRKPMVIMGPGTGLGVANVIKAHNNWVILPGEGGHIDCGPKTQREFQIWPHLEKINGRVSAEQVLCGRGLKNLYQAIAKADGIEAKKDIDEGWITKAALEKLDPAAIECCELFVTLLGRVAGDLALITLARGGVYIAGGVASKLFNLFETELFRTAFEDKAPHEKIMKEIPACIMTHPTAALEGLASFAQKPEFYIMDQATVSFKKA